MASMTQFTSQQMMPRDRGGDCRLPHGARRHEQATAFPTDAGTLRGLRTAAHRPTL